MRLLRRKATPPDLIASVKSEMNWAELLGRLSLIVIVAVAVPWVIGEYWPKSIRLAEQILIGLGLSTAGVLVQVAFGINKLLGRADSAVRLADARGSVGQLFAEMRLSADELLVQGNDLFSMYFRRELGRLNADLHTAVEKRELWFSQDSDTTEMMLQSFQPGSGHLVRAVHYLEDNDFLFDVHARHYFYSVVDAVKDRRLEGVRRLLILSAQGEFDDDRTRRLIQFHSSHSGFDYRVMAREDFDKIKRDSHLPNGKYDFAVYGNTFMYHSVVARSGDVSGVFKSSPADVGNHVSFFDRCWRSPLGRTHPKLHADISLEGLFEGRPVSLALDRSVHPPALPPGPPANG